MAMMFEPRQAMATLSVSREVLAGGGLALRRELRDVLRKGFRDMAGSGEVTQLRFRFNPFERDGDLDAPPASESVYVLQVRAIILTAEDSA